MKYVLRPITVFDLSNVESGQFINRLLTDIIETGTDMGVDPDVKEIYIDIQTQWIPFNKSLLQIVAQEESKELVKLDIIRDRKFTTLKRAHSVAEYTSDDAERKAYESIEIVLNKYKNIDVLNYEAETLSINKLIEELTNAEHKANAILIGLMPHIENLNVANKNFNTTFNNRSVKEISKETFNVKLIRKNIFESYKEFASVVLQKANRKNTDYYINLLKIVNNGREYYSNIIAKRNGGDKPDSSTDK